MLNTKNLIPLDERVHIAKPAPGVPPEKPKHPIIGYSPNWKSVAPIYTGNSPLARPIIRNNTYFGINIGLGRARMPMAQYFIKNAKAADLKQRLERYRINVNGQVTISDLGKAYRWIQLYLFGEIVYGHRLAPTQYVKSLIAEITSAEALYEYINAYSWYEWAWAYYYKLNHETLMIQNNYRKLARWYSEHRVSSSGFKCPLESKAFERHGHQIRLNLEEIIFEGIKYSESPIEPNDDNLLLNNDLLFSLGLGEKIVTDCSQEKLLNVAAVYRGLRQRLLAKDYETELEASLLYLAVLDLKIEYRRLQDKEESGYAEAGLEDVAELAESLQMMQGDISSPIWAEAA